MSAPAAWLPLHAVPITVVVTHPDFDDSILQLRAARDYVSRGDEYIRQIGDLDRGSRIVAVFEGHIKSTLGSGINL